MYQAARLQPCTIQFRSRFMIELVIITELLAMHVSLDFIAYEGQARIFNPRHHENLWSSCGAAATRGMRVLW